MFNVKYNIIEMLGDIVYDALGYGTMAVYTANVLKLRMTSTRDTKRQQNQMFSS